MLGEVVETPVMPPVFAAALAALMRGESPFWTFSLEDRAKSRKGKLLFDLDVLERWTARS